LGKNERGRKIEWKIGGKRSRFHRRIKASQQNTWNLILKFRSMFNKKERETLVNVWCRKDVSI